VLDDGDVQRALDSSTLRGVPCEVVSALIVGSRRIRVPAGATVHREGDAECHFELVLAGFMRAYVTAPDGRTMTVRYCRPGQIFGAATLFAAPFSMPAATQALVESELLSMAPATVRQLAGHEPALALALLTELSNRVMAFVSEAREGAFASVRQRLGHHLLDLASEQQRGGMLVARVSQQQLADAVGTVREVVVRQLRHLRAAGIVDTSRRGIVILQPQELLEWNQSP
jgi:CRP/FNR family transcriptional regulator, cyclic AMP receptor protein